MKITDIKKRFGNFSLNIPALDVSKPLIYGIIGSNACGKTTTLKLLAGLIKPDGGQIDWMGHTNRDITMAFKKPYLMRDTVYANLVYPLSIRGIKPDAAQIDRYLELANLAQYRERYAPSLSGGEQQKLSLIRALIFSPKVILIDEGFSNMDLESVTTFENHILERQREHPVTWVIVSHQLSNIKRLCDYVYFMHEGQIKAEGCVEAMLQHPEEPNLTRYLQYNG